MSEKKTIGASLELGTGNSVDNVNNLNKAINETKQALSDAAEKGTDYTKSANKLKDIDEDLIKSQTKLSNETAKAGKSFGNLKDIVAGLGIMKGVEMLFDVFKDTLGKNQKVADLFTTGMNFLTKAFNDLVSFLEKSVGPVTGWFKGIFENPQKAIRDFGEMVKNNIVERFHSMLDMIGYVGTAVKELFAGNFDKAAEAAKRAAKESVDMYTGVSNTVDKLGEAAGAVGEYVTQTWKAAEAQTAMQNRAKLAEAQLQGLVEEYDRQAEKQRQLRDDETKSIDERIAANDKLGEVLKNQQKAMIALADQKIASAKADLEANKGNIDMQVALTQAINERKGILAQITGLESEQKVNAVALRKEQQEMIKAQQESENKLLIERKKANAEIIQDELKKEETLKAIRDEERKIELQRLQENINATKEGTQARIEAQIAYNEKKDELDAADLESAKKIEDIKLQREKDLLSQRSENEMAIYNMKRGMLELERRDALQKAKALLKIAKDEARDQIREINRKRDAEVAAAEQAGLDTTEIKRKYAIQVEAINNSIAKSEKELGKAKKEATIEAAEASASTLENASKVLGETTGAGKALAIASATISTFVSAQKAYESTVGIPVVGPILAPINAGLAVAAGIMNVQKIASVEVPGEGGGAAAGNITAPAAPVAPTQAGTKLDAKSIQGVGNAASQGAGRSFVLDTDIKNNQERQARLQRAARLG